MYVALKLPAENLLKKVWESAVPARVQFCLSKTTNNQLLMKHTLYLPPSKFLLLTCCKMCPCSDVFISSLSPPLCPTLGIQKWHFRWNEITDTACTLPKFPKNVRIGFCYKWLLLHYQSNALTWLTRVV